MYLSIVHLYLSSLSVLTSETTEGKMRWSMTSTFTLDTADDEIQGEETGSVRCVASPRRTKRIANESHGGLRTE